MKLSDIPMDQLHRIHQNMSQRLQRGVDRARMREAGAGQWSMRGDHLIPLELDEHDQFIEPEEIPGDVYVMDFSKRRAG
jgi:hypothetical protein